MERSILSDAFLKKKMEKGNKVREPVKKKDLIFILIFIQTDE